MGCSNEGCGGFGEDVLHLAPHCHWCQDFEENLQERESILQKEPGGLGGNRCLCGGWNSCNRSIVHFLVQLGLCCHKITPLFSNSVKENVLDVALILHLSRPKWCSRLRISFPQSFCSDSNNTWTLLLFVAYLAECWSDTEFISWTFYTWTRCKSYEKVQIIKKISILFITISSLYRSLRRFTRIKSCFCCLITVTIMGQKNKNKTPFNLF